MKPRDPSLHNDDNAEPLFSADLRAELRRELGPSAASRARVRDGLWSSVAAGALSPTAQRVDTLLHGQTASAAGTAGAAGAKAATAAVHSLTAKLVIASVLVGGGATAVMLREPAHERPAVVAPAPAKPVVSATENLPEASRDLPAQPEAEARPAHESVKQSAATEMDSPAVRLQPTASNKSRAEAPGARLPRLRSAITNEPRSASQPKRSAAHAPRSAPAEQPQPTAAVESPSQPSAPGEPSTEDNPAPLPLSAANERYASAPQPPSQEPGPVSTPAPVPESQPTHKHALAAEIALVRAASEALQRNDPQSALAQLQRHGTEFPSGALRVEAAALRAIALCAAHSDQAAAVSGKFLQTHAGSPLAARVRRACPKP